MSPRLRVVVRVVCSVKALDAPALDVSPVTFKGITINFHHLARLAKVCVTTAAVTGEAVTAALLPIPAQKKTDCWGAPCEQPGGAGIVSCHDGDPDDYCDCAGDCHEHPSWCSCGEAQACCSGKSSSTHFFKLHDGQQCMDAANSQLITDEKTCRDAAKQLGYQYETSGHWTAVGDFPGCLHANDGRNKVYFNTASASEATGWNAKYAAICTTPSFMNWAGSYALTYSNGFSSVMEINCDGSVMVDGLVEVVVRTNWRPPQTQTVRDPHAWSWRESSEELAKS